MTFVIQFPDQTNGILFSRQRMRRAEGRVSLPAAVSVDWSLVASFTMASNELGYLIGYSNQVIDPSWDYNGAIVFRVLINGSPLDDADSFSEQRGTIPNMAAAFQFCQTNDIIALQVRRAIAGTSSRDIVMAALFVTWPSQMMPVFPQRQQ